MCSAFKLVNDADANIGYNTQVKLEWRVNISRRLLSASEDPETCSIEVRATGSCWHDVAAIETALRFYQRFFLLAGIRIDTGKRSSRRSAQGES